MSRRSAANAEPLGRRSSAGAITVAGLTLVAAAAASWLVLPGPERPLWEVPASSTTVVLYILTTVAVAMSAIVVALEPPPRGRLSATTALAALTLAWAALVFLSRLDAAPALRFLAVVVGALAPAALLHLAVATVRWRSRAATVLVAAGYALCGGTAAMRAMVTEPIRDPFCRVGCNADSWILVASSDLSRLLSVILLGASAAVAGTALLTSIVGLSRRSGSPAALIALVPVALVELVLPLTPHARPGLGSLPDYGEALFVARCVSTIILAVLLMSAAIGRARRMARVRSGLQRLADGSGGGSLEGLLSRALRDPGLRVTYWLPSLGRWADANAAEASPPSGRTLTITREDETVARVIASRPSLSLEEVESAAGAAARLVIDNERLRVELLAQSGELRASRLRVVQTSDAARRRLERDLHDGAQQRLLAASYSYRLAAAEASDAAAVDEADRRLAVVLDVLARLRETARGVYPPVLADAGLVPALEGLARLQVHRDLTIDAPPLARIEPAVELTAYLVVREALLHPGTATVRATLEHTDAALLLELTGAEAYRLDRVADRVAALGGTISRRADRVSMEVPCG